MSKPNIQIWKIDDIRPYDKNAKKHPAEQVAKIAESIKRFGWTQPIVVDRDGSIIAGHGRRLAAISLGLAEIPVWVRDDLSSDEVKALRLADNRAAESSIDTLLLQEELKNLDFDMSGIFDTKELDFMLADLGELAPDAFVEDLNAEVKRQDFETKEKIKSVDARPVKIHDALGFKTIQGADERAVVMFQATIEAETGLTGAAAFVEHAKRHALGAK